MDCFGLYIWKIDASGLVFCIYCNKPVSYGSSGKKDILAHARKSPNHLRNKKDYHQSTCLPLSWSQPSSTTELHKCTPKSSRCNLPYGIAENVHATSKCPAMHDKINPVVSLVEDSIQQIGTFQNFEKKPGFLEKCSVALKN